MRSSTDARARALHVVPETPDDHRVVDLGPQRPDLAAQATEAGGRR